jgi:hypothetical protein
MIRKLSRAWHEKKKFAMSLRNEQIASTSSKSEEKANELVCSFGWFPSPSI